MFTPSPAQKITTSQNVVSLVLAFALALACPVAQAEVLTPHYYAARRGSLEKVKIRLQSGDRELAKALKNLIAEADATLPEAPPSVMYKTKAPPGGDRHDYMSLAPYFWPDPESKTGLPYIRHDGKVNPESRDEKINDSPRIRQMGDAIETLALAYYFTGDPKYAAAAGKRARVWFLDPATRMNPHLKYAQAIPGVNDGRGTGILEGRHLAQAADALGLLSGSSAWPAADAQALQAWLGTYFDWLLNSRAGREEGAAKNNHGTWYDVQAVELALCLGRTNVAASRIADARMRRIAVQIEPDGRQPLELARTTSFSYSCFNLYALGELATLGQHVGIDLWSFQTSDGRSLRRALDFLLPYMDRPAKKWPYPQIKEKHDQAEFLPLLRQASLAFHVADYESVLEKYSEAGSKRFQLCLLP